MQRDIFDDMMQRIECGYVSDLKYNQNTVAEKLKNVDLSVYEKKQLEEFAQYVFNCGWEELVRQLQL